MAEVTASNGPGDESVADLLDVLGRTADAMVAIDGDLNIVGWNDAATRLLGYEANEALGRPCHEVMCWDDRHGETICDGQCPATSIGDPDELVETREVLGRSAAGRRLWLSASTIVPPVELRDEVRLVHLLREVSFTPEVEKLLVERLGGSSDGPGPLDVLTAREREVLQLLTEGLDGTAVAERLFVSPATVRNHVQHILTKLGVHSRVEAVALALRGR